MKISIVLKSFIFLGQFLLIQSRTNQEPVNIGFIFSLPWDVANTLRAPLAGPLSIALAASLALICFAGLAFAPVWYIFGLPKRKYYMHNIPNSRSWSGDEEARSASSSLFNQNFGPDLLNLNSTEELSINFNYNFYPNFGESVFLFFPHEVDHSCKLLILCHAHGFLPLLPQFATRIFHFFSKKLVEMGADYGEAIRVGFDDQGKCITTYDSCPFDIVTIAKLTFYHNIPMQIRQWWDTSTNSQM